MPVSRPPGGSDDSSRHPTRPSPLSHGGKALINRNFTLIWTGQAFSDVASEMTSLALPLVVLASTRSPAAAGLVGTAVGIAQLAVMLPGGLVADMVDRRRLMMLCDVGRSVLALLLSVTLLTGYFTTSLAVAAATATAVLSTLFGPAYGGLLRQVVPAGQRRKAVTRNVVRTNAAIAVGPPLGGLLLGLGAPVAFAIDAVSYLFSMALLSRVRPGGGSSRPVSTAKRTVGRGLWRLCGELTLGLHWLMRRRALLALVALVAYVNLLGRAVELLAAVGASSMGSHPAAAGVILTAAGCGGIVGGLCTGWVLRRLRPSVILLSVIAVWSLLIPLTAAGRQPVTISAVFLLVVGLPVISSLVSLAVVTEAPAEIQGRASTAVTLAAISVAWIGPGATGYLISAHGVRAAALLLAAPLVVALVPLVVSRRFRAAMDSLGNDAEAELAAPNAAAQG